MHDARCPGQLSTVRSQDAAGGKPLRTRQTHADPPRQFDGVIAVRSTYGFFRARVGDGLGVCGSGNAPWERR